MMDEAVENTYRTSAAVSVGIIAGFAGGLPGMLAGVVIGGLYPKKRSLIVCFSSVAIIAANVIGKAQREAGLERASAQLQARPVRTAAPPPSPR